MAHHSTDIDVEIVGTKVGDQGRSCNEHENCSVVLRDNVVVHLQKLQVLIDGREKMAITAIWVTNGIGCCHVGFLPCHILVHAKRYDGELAQVTHVFMQNATCPTKISAAAQQQSFPCHFPWLTMSKMVEKEG